MTQPKALGAAKGKFSSATLPEEESIGESIQVDSQYSKSMGPESLVGLESASEKKDSSATMPKNKFSAHQAASRSNIDTESNITEIKSEIESQYTEDFDDQTSHASKSAVGVSKSLL